MTRTLQRQQGNTLTGIIIGLIIGLVIAVIVALAITKGTTPFTDKSGKLGKMSEPTAGQVADPNKPLYGNKEAAREANREIAEKTKGADDPLGQAIAGMKPAAVAPAAPVAAAAPVAVATAEEKTVYYLQAGAFREMTDAENTRAKLALLGFEAAITDRANESGVLHRVRVGPYDQVESMNKARAKLLDSGIDVAIVRNQK
jgi:cell division protein FtsN